MSVLSLHQIDCILAHIFGGHILTYPLLFRDEAYSVVILKLQMINGKHYIR